MALYANCDVLLKTRHNLHVMPSMNVTTEKAEENYFHASMEILNATVFEQI